MCIVWNSSFLRNSQSRYAADKTSPYVNESERCVTKRFISDSSMLEIKRLSHAVECRQ